jgi:hypothetical protein
MIWLLAGIIIVVAGVAVFCVTLTDCEITEEPTSFMFVCTFVPVVLDTGPALIGPEKVV